VRQSINKPGGGNHRTAANEQTKWQNAPLTFHKKPPHTTVNSIFPTLPNRKPPQKLRPLTPPYPGRTHWHNQTASVFVITPRKCGHRPHFSGARGISWRSDFGISTAHHKTPISRLLFLRGVRKIKNTCL